MFVLPKSTRVKVVLAVVGTILLGALGSGFWEYVLEPSLLGARDVVLNVASLGVARFKEQLYMEIANGAPESVAITVLVQTTFLLVVVVGILTFLAFLARRWLFRQRKKMEDEIDAFLKWEDGNKAEEPPSPEAIRSNIQQVKDRLEQLPWRLLSVFSYALLLLSVLLLSVLIVNMSRVVYIRDARSHFQQLITIAAPHIDDEHVKILRARFASARNKVDYVAVVDSLRSVIKKAGQEPPKFSSW